MEREKIRTKIREKLRSGILPRHPILLERLQPGEPIPVGIRVGRVAGELCSACDESDPVITYNYPAGPIRFHEACDRIWQEEREKIFRE